MKKKRKKDKAKRISYRKLWRSQVKENEELKSRLHELEDQYVQLDQMTENDARGMGTPVYLACLANGTQVVGHWYAFRRGS